MTSEPKKRAQKGGGRGTAQMVRLAMGLLILSAALAQAQVTLPPDIDFFGGDLLRAPQNDGGEAGKASPATAGYAQTLVFSDGRELRGELVEMTRDEIIWRRPDAGEALRFPRSEVRRIVTGPAGVEPSNGMVPGVAGNPAHPPFDGATLKLPGGDWLFGKVTSADGQSFAVELTGGAQLAIARTQIEWMHFGANPVPAFGFSVSALDMEGWLPASATMELAGSTLTVKGVPWIGRAMTPPNRFEVSFELPEDSEEGTRLWLQPFGPQPNCYGTGTAEIRFGRKEIAHLLFTDKFERQSAPLPVEALKEKGPGKYRVFYDGTAKRIVVRRNGREVGDWKYFTEKDKPADEAVRNIQFNALCFDRENRGEGTSPLKFNRLRIQPWDGNLPKEGQIEDGLDHLSTGETAEIAGKLESVTDKEMVFSGATRPRQGGTTVRFSGAPPAVLAGAEAKLEFGSQGEFIARNLRVREGKVLGETIFSSALELPLGTLQNITFQGPAMSAPPAASLDMLVFKNADELPGKALSATLPGPVRWRMVSGQEVEFQPGRIAGIRLAGAVPSVDPKAAAADATVELRSGERLRGRLVAWDEKHVQLEHPLLGSLGLDRNRLWRLFPVRRFDAVDGGRAPGGWKWKEAEEGSAEGRKTGANSDQSIYLDGTYVLRGHGYVGSFNWSELPGVERSIDPGLERFEVRIEAASQGSLPNFILMLTGKGDTSLRAMICYSNLQLTMQHATGNRRSPWRNIALAENLFATNGPRALRLFVDTKAGTCDLAINGVPVVRLGQEENERLLAGEYTAKIQPYPNQGMATVFSNIWIGPWNGELPSPAKAADETTALANGDVAKGTPKALHDGKFTIDSELGELDIPVEKTLAVDFGGALDAQKVAGRLRLVDGTVVNVERFNWDGHALTAHSSTLGDLRLPDGVVSELIYDPSPVHPPTPVGASKLAKKDSAKKNSD
ncbi:MAG: hypothetical protein ABJF10_15565 [Chthoniobacter sp.]|uniref:hypothetical protein n=1 Tax=Chthoniobacter sp. TaxID=2510640 RepID=UPI0032A5C9E3